MLQDCTALGHAITKIPLPMGRSYPGIYRIEILKTPIHHHSEYQWLARSPDGAVEEELTAYLNLRFAPQDAPAHWTQKASPGWPYWGEFLMWIGNGLCENHGPPFKG